MIPEVIENCKAVLEQVVERGDGGFAQYNTLDLVESENHHGGFERAHLLRPSVKYRVGKF